MAKAGDGVACIRLPQRNVDHTGGSELLDIVLSFSTQSLFSVCAVCTDMMPFQQSFFVTATRTHQLGYPTRIVEQSGAEEPLVCANSPPFFLFAQFRLDVSGGLPSASCHPPAAASAPGSMPKTDDLVMAPNISSGSVVRRLDPPKSTPKPPNLRRWARSPWDGSLKRTKPNAFGENKQVVSPLE